jgi:hypothetical protein
MNSQAMMPVRSTFVTVLAWVFIGITGFATLISLMQNLMLQLIFVPLMQQQHAHMSQNLPSDMPVQMGWMFDHVIWIFRLFLLLSLLLLVAAIGLLLRKEWARKLFVGLMAFGILYQIAGLFFQWWYMNAVFDHFPMPPNPKVDVAQMMQMMRGLMTVIRIFSALMSIGMTILFGWIIKKLISTPIRQEFMPALASNLVSRNTP